MARPLPPLPAHVRGGICEYEVRILPRAEYDPVELKEGLHESVADRPFIAVAADLPNHWRWQTFMHELIHMVEEEQKIDLTEAQVESLALGLYSCWRRNGWALPGQAAA